uniref:Uncharacterized protein n=1 Tax=Anguilla anguilla TaxID=7936 RepID=A0A0E9SKY7_ANGAN
MRDVSKLAARHLSLLVILHFTIYYVEQWQFVDLKFKYNF